MRYQLNILAINIIASVLPSEKADKICWLQSLAFKRNNKIGKAIVAIVRDSINDSFAFIIVNARIAIGSDLNLVILNAKFVLMSLNLHFLLTFITLLRIIF